MSGRTLYTGWIVALALLGALLLGMGPSRAEVSSARPALASPALALSHASPASPPAADTFLHVDHDGMFPLCTGCHLGAETGFTADLYPTAESCAECHDGEVEATVEWAGPTALETNLTYDHGEHIAVLEAQGEAMLGCADCHGDPAPRVLEEPRVLAEECLSCHDDERVDEVSDRDHYVAAECALCHLPAATSSLGAARIAALPTPPDHTVDAEDSFLAVVHGEAAAARADDRCTTCHVKDQCATCHVNATRVAEIRALPTDPARRPFPDLGARYPTPASHTAARFAWSHVGVAEADGSNCATCHTGDSCRSCHLEPVPAPVAGLVHRDPPPGLDAGLGGEARRDTVTAPGAEVDARPPESHESAFFMERHGTVAAVESNSCATCHAEESYCASCHERQMEGGAGAVYHAPNYTLSHAAEAANAVSECSNCHDTAVFCRDCHTTAGLGSSGRLGPGYHDAEPLWLLRHPQAARQQLETCAGCHTQTDCLQCHSQLGAFQISPHGADFDARAAYARNPVVCRACHLGDPFGGGGGA